MSTPAGVVLDVDGTLVDSEQEGHRVAFNTAFERAGLPYRWDRAVYRELLRIPGGQPRVRHYLVAAGVPEAEAEVQASALHQNKTRHFLDRVLDGGVPLRPGARRFVDDLRAAGLPLYVATAGSRTWVEPLLRGHFDDDTFALVLTGSEVPELKPAPDIYRAVLDRTGLAARDLVAVEDSLNGLRAAHGAGLPCLVVLNEESEGDFSAAELVTTGFGPGAGYVSGLAGPEAVHGGWIGVGTLAAVARAGASDVRDGTARTDGART
jgi:HAD superfamily hydrolase (TIGR01509 family)